jgi:hypothetical protein
VSVLGSPESDGLRRAARHFERWLICNMAQIALMKSHTVRGLRHQATRYADAAAISGRKWPVAWLEQVEGRSHIARPFRLTAPPAV